MNNFEIAICKLLVSLILYTAPFFLFGQTSDLFSEILSSEKSIVNGKEWIPENIHIQGHPYFSEQIWKKGVIFFDGEKYENVVFNYNIYRDELIIFYLNEEGVKFFVLNKVLTERFEFIDSSEAKPYLFVNINYLGLKDTINQFMQLIYDGETGLFISHKKHINISSAQEYFMYKRKCYLKKENHLYLFRNKSSLLSLLPERKKQLKEYIRKNRLKIMLKNPSDIKKLLSYYDQNK